MQIEFSWDEDSKMAVYNYQGCALNIRLDSFQQAQVLEHYIVTVLGYARREGRNELAVEVMNLVDG